MKHSQRIVEREGQSLFTGISWNKRQAIGLENLTVPEGLRLKFLKTGWCPFKRGLVWISRADKQQSGPEPFSNGDLHRVHFIYYL